MITVTNTVLRKWAKGKATTNAWLLIGNTLTAEAVASMGFDSVTIDLQHGVINQEDVVPMVQAIAAARRQGPGGGGGGGSAEGAAAAAAAPWARVQANDPGRLHRLLDAGVEGVICPMINNKKECEDFVSACLYPPHGTRSFGPTRAKLTDPEYFLKANDNIIKMAMIETKSGLDNLDDILSVDKLDGVFIGPNDLALGLGRTPANDPTDPVVVKAIEKIRMAAIAANKKVGIFCGTAEAAQIMAAQGFHMVCPGSDLGHLMSSYRKTLQNLTTAGGA